MGIKKRVGVLQQAGLVRTEKVGRVRPASSVGEDRKKRPLGSRATAYYCLRGSRMEFFGTYLEGCDRHRIDGRNARSARPTRGPEIRDEVTQAIHHLPSDERLSRRKAVAALLLAPLP